MALECWVYQVEGDVTSAADVMSPKGELLMVCNVCWMQCLRVSFVGELGTHGRGKLAVPLASIFLLSCLWAAVLTQPSRSFTAV